MITRVIIFLLFASLVFTFFNIERKTTDNFSDNCICKASDHQVSEDVVACWDSCQQTTETLAYAMDCTEAYCNSNSEFMMAYLISTNIELTNITSLEFLITEDDLSTPAIIAQQIILRDIIDLQHYKMIVYKPSEVFTYNLKNMLTLGDEFSKYLNLKSIHLEFASVYSYDISFYYLLACNSCDIYIDFNYIMDSSITFYPNLAPQFVRVKNIENLTLLIRHDSHPTDIFYHSSVRNIFISRLQNDKIYEKLYQSVTLYLEQMIEPELYYTLEHMNTLKLTLLLLKNNQILQFTKNLRLNNFQYAEVLKSLEIQAQKTEIFDTDFIKAILFQHQNLEELNLKLNINVIHRMNLLGMDFNKLKVLKLDFYDNNVKEVLLESLLNNKIGQMDELYIDISYNPVYNIYYSRDIFQGLKIKKATFLFQDLLISSFNIFQYLQNFSEIEDLTLKISTIVQTWKFTHSSIHEKTFPTIVNSAWFEFKNHTDIMGIHTLIEQLKVQQVPDVTIVLNNEEHKFNFSTETQVPYFTGDDTYQLKSAFGQNLNDQTCSDSNCLRCDDTDVNICLVCNMATYLEIDNLCYDTKTYEEAQECNVMGQGLRENFFQVNTQIERVVVDDEAIYHIESAFQNEDYLIDPDNKCNLSERLFLSNSTGLAIPFQRSGHTMNFTISEKDIIDKKYCSNSYKEGQILYICQFIQEVQMIQKRMVYHKIEFLLEFDQFMTFQLSGIKNSITQETRNNEDALKKLQALYSMKICSNYAVPSSCASIENDESIILAIGKTFEVVIQMDAPLNVYNVLLEEASHIDGDWTYSLELLPSVHLEPGLTVNRFTPYLRENTSTYGFYKFQYSIKKPTIPNRLLQEQDEFEDQNVSLGVKIKFEDEIEKNASVSKSNDDLSDELILIIVLSSVFLLSVIVLVLFLKFRSLKNKGQKKQEIKYKQTDQLPQTQPDALSTEMGEKIIN